MSNRKKLLTVAAVLFSMMTATAEVLVVEEKNGDKQHYELGENPVITYSGAKLLVKSTKASAEFSIPEVEKYYFLKEVTVSELINEGEKPVIWATDNSISFRNTKANQTVQVYNAQGQLSGIYKTDAQGSLDIDLSQFGRGILIVKTTSSTLKFVR